MRFLLQNNDKINQKINKDLINIKNSILNLIPEKYVKSIILSGELGKEEGVIINNCFLLNDYKILIIYEKDITNINFYIDACKYLLFSLSRELTIPIIPCFYEYGFDFSSVNEDIIYLLNDGYKILYGIDPFDSNLPIKFNLGSELEYIREYIKLCNYLLKIKYRDTENNFNTNVDLVIGKVLLQILKLYLVPQNLYKSSFKKNINYLKKIEKKNLWMSLLLKIVEKNVLNIDLKTNIFDNLLKEFEEIHKNYEKWRLKKDFLNWKEYRKIKKSVTDKKEKITNNFLFYLYLISQGAFFNIRYIFKFPRVIIFDYLPELLYNENINIKDYKKINEVIRKFI